MKKENEKLIIDGNTIYELDLECVRKKQKEQERKGRHGEKFTEEEITEKSGWN